MTPFSGGGRGSSLRRVGGARRNLGKKNILRPTRISFKLTRGGKGRGGGGGGLAATENKLPEINGLDQAGRERNE